MDKEEHLVEGEKLIYSAEGANENLYLTNRRVIYTGQTGLFSQNAKFKDIEFHHISSVEWGTISHPWLLVVGILSFIIGLSQRGDLTTVLVIVGVVFVLLYIYYRKAGIIFITENEKVPFNFGGSKSETYVKEITKIIREADNK